MHMIGSVTFRDRSLFLQNQLTRYPAAFQGSGRIPVDGDVRLIRGDTAQRCWFDCLKTTKRRSIHLTVAQIYIHRGESWTQQRSSSGEKNRLKEQRQQLHEKPVKTVVPNPQVTADWARPRIFFTGQVLVVMVVRWAGGDVEAYDVVISVNPLLCSCVCNFTYSFFRL